MDQQLIAGLTEVRDALATGVDMRDRSTVRKVEITEPGTYIKTDVRGVRESLNMSQSIFTMALGVSVVLVRSWESGG